MESNYADNADSVSLTPVSFSITGLSYLHCARDEGHVWGVMQFRISLPRIRNTILFAESQNGQLLFILKSFWLISTFKDWPIELLLNIDYSFFSPAFEPMEAA